MAKVWVRNATSALRKVIISSPKYYWPNAINESAKNWVLKGEIGQNDGMVQEWTAMIGAYKDAGIEITEVTADRRLQLQCLSRDFGACVKEGVIMGHFRHPARQKEVKVYEKRLRELGVPVIARCNAGCFEGGDFWMLDEHTLAFGLVDRTDRAGVENLREQLANYGYTVVTVPVSPANVHLDAVFNIVAEKVALAAASQLSYGFLQALKRRGFTIIDVSQRDDHLVPRHACDVQSLGDGKVLAIAENKGINEKMRALGLNVLELEFRQLVASGGGPHRMTFPVERW